MKLSGIILMILMVGFIFFAAGVIIDDFETYYPDVMPVNKTIRNVTSWDTEFNYNDRIFEHTNFISEKWLDLTSSESSFFLKAESLLTIPIAVIWTPFIMISALSYQVYMIADFADILQIPYSFVTWAVTGVSVIIIFGLIAWWRKDKKT